ncbi:c-type cytochrome [Marinivivus vitaminiproducens]|uniref:c-type cytochrome n=1 Tax=Marinivivus vitaminiproducens TaxID=3035935 RepID=UPI0027A78A68|nr:c-type cytochrome [Geminicoccaceae bacterium SCSIO 64248]
MRLFESLARLGTHATVALAAGWLAQGALAQDQNQQPAAEAGGEQAVELTPEHPYIVKDGKVDFGVYNGYRRYHSVCHTCHGPDGLGGSFAPNLVHGFQDGKLNYDNFLDTVVNGRQNGNSVMPSFGMNTDVMNYIDDIYAYLKARADDAVGRGRPQRLPPEEDPIWQERRG